MGVAAIVLSSCVGKSECADCVNTIRVGSFNVLGHYSQERGKIGEEIVRLYYWDIFGTQEMHEWSKKIYLSSGKFGISGRPCATKIEDPKCWEIWGNYIIYKKSRFEPLDEGYFWLSQTPDKLSKGWDAGQYRICNWVKLRDKLANKTVFFFDLHMPLTEKARLESAKLVNRKIAEIADKDSVILMTGDFNAKRDSAPINEIVSAGIVSDSCDAPVPHFGPKGTFIEPNANNPVCDKSAKTNGIRIDYVFASPNMEVLNFAVIPYNIDGKFGSDHLPVMATLRYK